MKQRLVGAIVIAALAVIFIPMLLERGDEDARRRVDMRIPPKPETAFQDRLPDDMAKQRTLVSPAPLAESVATAKQDYKDRYGTMALQPDTAAAVAEQDASDATSASSAPTSTNTFTTAAESASASAEQWLIQVGSFRQETNAIVVRDQLQQQGFAAAVAPARSDVGVVYRVQIGPMAERAVAEQLRQRLQTEHKINGIVVADQ